MTDRHTADSITSDALDQLYDGLDGAYRERAHLVALLAAMTDGAVIAPASDIEEPGWQIAYLRLGGWQASWHIAPRDAELFTRVEQVAADDPRAQWDGHTTDQKYTRIRQHTRVLQLRGQEPYDRCLCPPTQAGLELCARCPGHDAAPMSSGPAATQATEHCGHLSPETLLTSPRTECVLRPGHHGSHADDRGCRWWPIPDTTDAAPIDTAHRYCILCGNQFQPGHTCDPAGLRTVYGSLVQRAERKHERAEQLAATLREVLHTFTLYRHTRDGTRIGYQGATIDPAGYDRWHAVLEPAKEQQP